jgi:hypothetical protein
MIFLVCINHIYSQQNWWVERYDGRSRSAFLFNVLTGERQPLSQASSLMRSRNSAPNIAISSSGEDGEMRDEYGHSILTAEGDDDGGGVFSHQIPGPELDFMRKRRNLYRALLTNLRASSSASTPSVVYSGSVNNSEIAAGSNSDNVDNSGPQTSSSSTSSQADTKFLWMRTLRSDVLSSMIARFSSWDVKLLKMKRIKVLILLCICVFLRLIHFLLIYFKEK